ncbi:hypothetical protein VUR80DRAFT_4907 [Thermomyces stellatus]
MGVIHFIENMDRTSLTITDEEFEKNVEAAVSAIAEKHRPQSPIEPQPSEKPSNTLQPPGDSSARRSFEASPGEPSTPGRSTSDDAEDDGAPITGLLRTIQKPLTTIGRIFSDEPPSGPANTPRTPVRAGEAARQQQQEGAGEQGAPRGIPAEEAAARQASAEAAEAQRLHRAEHANVVETLSGMFPDLDKEVISDVVYQKQGR